MRLSEAIMLGDSLKEGNSIEWLSEDGSCGCAFGGALLAAGVDAAKFNLEYMALYKEKWVGTKQGTMGAVSEASAVRKLWPWVTPEILGKISRLYSFVYHGVATIEEVADYAKSIEPEEPVKQCDEVKQATSELVTA